MATAETWESAKILRREGFTFHRWLAFSQVGLIQPIESMV
jgi:hypothetical protein